MYQICPDENKTYPGSIWKRTTKFNFNVIKYYSVHIQTHPR